ncbi:hypothetical protein [Methylobacterium sp. Leaf85]|uniref:hypothetical protein n=1 Tax=Methylobacterium sp. Leaf85 TaxID=1736241 RepID=UPI0012E9439B|nr:hypothetical protein [Methylobacterium sp. Leaf85]
MIIQDDADMATVVSETVAALNESAKHVGKADRTITGAQIKDIQDAIAVLQNVLRFKGGSSL